MTLTLTEQAPSFDLPGIDGRNHALDDYGEAEVLVLIQSCNHCPYVQAWEQRIVAINSNDTTTHPEDSFEEMARRAERHGFNFDYLYDKDQSVAGALGSERTPEIFVFDRERKLVYHGAVDDSRDETMVDQRYLRDALDAVLEGRRPPVAETPPVGCTVKWNS